MNGPRIKEFQPGRGYSREDWDEVSDNPPLTAEEIANMRPLRDILPELAAAIDREIAKRGRPPVENPRQAVTLRLAPETLARFKAKGRNWRAEMARILDEAG